jgi:riboflavin transporter FmnP
VEFVALLYFGQNVPIGPALKLFALLSTVAGMWLGSAVAMRMKAAGVGKVVAFSGVVGSVVRASVMTVPNYVYLLYLVSQYTLGGVEDTLKASFALVGVTLSDANALAWILGFTAVFNVIQLLIVVGLSYSVLRFPPVSNLRVGGRAPWFVSLTGGKARPQATAQ